MIDHTAREASAAVYDYDVSVPAAIVGRWNRMDQDRAVLTDLAVLFIVTGSLLTAVAAGVGLFLGASIGSVVLIVIAAGAVLLLARLWRRRLVRGGRLLEPRLMDLVINHRYAVHFTTAESASDEAELAHRARLIASDLVASPAWHSETLNGHADQIDPVEEARQIHVTAWRLRRFRDRLGEQPGGDDPLGEHLAAEWRHLDAHADANLHSLRERVDRLEQYWSDVLAMDELMERRQRLADLRRLADERLPLLAVDQATHELAVDRLAQLDLQASIGAAALRNDGSLTAS